MRYDGIAALGLFGVVTGVAAVWKPISVTHGSSLFAQVYEVSPINGLWAGHPNQFDHRYRICAAFDLRTALPTGAVKRAVLSWEVTEVAAGELPREVILEHCTMPAWENAPLWISANRFEELANVVVEENAVFPLHQSMEVTEAVNRDLADGHLLALFRWRDGNAERSGNLFNRAAGYRLGTVLQLEIEWE